MPLNSRNIRKLLASFDLRIIFIEELGWDNYPARPLELSIAEKGFILQPLAEKRGMAAFVCTPTGGGRMPDYPTRRKIEKQVAKSIHEHLIVYVDKKKSIQIWQWVKREPGKPAACREHTYHSGQSGDALVQKLEHLFFDLAEEEGITITDVTGRARRAFDVDRVTQRFYDRFKT